MGTCCVVIDRIPERRNISGVNEIENHLAMMAALLHR